MMDVLKAHLLESLFFRFYRRLYKGHHLHNTVMTAVGVEKLFRMRNSTAVACVVSPAVYHMRLLDLINLLKLFFLKWNLIIIGEAKFTQNPIATAAKEVFTINKCFSAISLLAIKSLPFFFLLFFVFIIILKRWREGQKLKLIFNKLVLLCNLHILKFLGALKNIHFSVLIRVLFIFFLNYLDQNI